MTEAGSIYPQKTEQLGAAPQKILFPLLKHDEALVAHPHGDASTPVDVNMNRLGVPSDKRLITLLNYNLLFFLIL